MFEGALVVALIATIIGVLVDRARDLQARAEVGSFQYNLGALRVALAVRQVEGQLRSQRPVQLAAQNSAVVPHASDTNSTNPFTLLARVQPNVMAQSLADAKGGALPPGWWFHDSACRCIGYRPNDARRLIVPSGGDLMIFNVQLDVTQLNVGGGLLAAREPYLWWGEAIH